MSDSFGIARLLLLLTFVWDGLDQSRQLVDTRSRLVGRHDRGSAVRVSSLICPSIGWVVWVSSHSWAAVRNLPRVAHSRRAPRLTIPPQPSPLPAGVYRFWFTFTSTTTYLEDPSNPVVRSANSTAAEVTLVPAVPELPAMPSVWLQGPSVVNPGQALRVSGGSLTVLLRQDSGRGGVCLCAGWKKVSFDVDDGAGVETMIPAWGACPGHGP